MILVVYGGLNLVGTSDGHNRLMTQSFSERIGRPTTVN